MNHHPGPSWRTPGIEPGINFRPHIRAEMYKAHWRRRKIHPVQLYLFLLALLRTQRRMFAFFNHLTMQLGKLGRLIRLPGTLCIATTRQNDKPSGKYHAPEEF